MVARISMRAVPCKRYVLSYITQSSPSSMEKEIGSSNTDSSRSMVMFLFAIELVRIKSNISIGMVYRHFTSVAVLGIQPVPTPASTARPAHARCRQRSKRPLSQSHASDARRRRTTLWPDHDGYDYDVALQFRGVVAHPMS